MVDVALIPPYCRLNDLRNRVLQMFLPTNFSSDERERYLALSKRSGRRQSNMSRSHVILDNGLFEEGESLSSHDLLRMAVTYQVDEIVAPDVRDDRQGTIEAVNKFLNAYEAQNATQCLMVVVQGKNPDARHNFIREIADLVPSGTVIGFPRRLTQEDTRTRLQLMEYTIETYGNQFPLHMLGMSREWPSEFLRAVRQFGSHLRGMDTSAPYVYAFNGKTIHAFWEADTERIGDYFNIPSHMFPNTFVQYNIYVLESWAESLEPMPFYQWEELRSDMPGM